MENAAQILTPIPGRTLPKGFRLIDVKRYCIVDFEKPLQFVALSYVWGNLTSDMAIPRTQDSYAKHEPSSLTSAVGYLSNLLVAFVDDLTTRLYLKVKPWLWDVLLGIAKAWIWETDSLPQTRNADRLNGQKKEISPRNWHLCYSFEDDLGRCRQRKRDGAVDHTRIKLECHDDVLHSGKWYRCIDIILWCVMCVGKGGMCWHVLGVTPYSAVCIETYWEWCNLYPNALNNTKFMLALAGQGVLIR